MKFIFIILTLACLTWTSCTITDTELDVNTNQKLTTNEQTQQTVESTLMNYQSSLSVHIDTNSSWTFDGDECCYQPWDYINHMEYVNPILFASSNELGIIRLLFNHIKEPEKEAPPLHVGNLLDPLCDYCSCIAPRFFILGSYLFAHWESGWQRQKFNASTCDQYDWFEGLRIFDITDPLNITLKKEYLTDPLMGNGRIPKLDYERQLAFITNNSEQEQDDSIALEIYNLEDPFNIELVGSLNLAGLEEVYCNTDSYYAQNQLYLTGYDRENNWLYVVVDTKDLNMLSYQLIDLPIENGKIFKEHDFAIEWKHFEMDSTTMIFFDITDLNNPFMQSQITFEIAYVFLKIVEKYPVVYLYTDNFITACDVSDLSNVHCKETQVDYDNFVLFTTIDDSYLIASGNDNSILVFDISIPLEPTLISEIKYMPAYEWRVYP
jgi:hypothetical protein